MGGMVCIRPENALIVLQELFNTIMFMHNKEIVNIYEQLYEGDFRIKQIIDLLRDYNNKLKTEIINEKSSFNLNIRFESLDYLADKCFPLCMGEIFKSL